MIHPSKFLRPNLVLLTVMLAAGSWLVSCICSRGDIGVSRSENHMGTAVSINVMSSNQEKAEKAIVEAFAEFRRLDPQLSHYNEASELRFLNKEGRIEEASEDLMRNILRSLAYVKLSKGAFDSSVLPILDLYNVSFKNKNRPPSDAETQETLKYVDYRKISVQDSSIALREGQHITLGGIDKGYAVDAAVGTLQSPASKGPSSTRAEI